MLMYVACQNGKFRIFKMLDGQGVNSSLKKWWNSHTVKNETKVRLWKALLVPVTMYACESWPFQAQNSPFPQIFSTIFC